MNMVKVSKCQCQKVSEQAIESYFLIYTSRMGILLKSVGRYHDQLYRMVWVMLSAMDKSVDFVKQFTLIFAVYAEYVLTEFNLTHIVSALSFPFQNKVDLRTIATWRRTFPTVIAVHRSYAQTVFLI